jgi:hypothetical protein
LAGEANHAGDAGDVQGGGAGFEDGFVEGKGGRGAAPGDGGVEAQEVVGLTVGKGKTLGDMGDGEAKGLEMESIGAESEEGLAFGGHARDFLSIRLRRSVEVKR